VRKHVGDDPVSVAFIAACTAHHIPLWYSSALIVMRAKLKRLVTEKARFKMLGVRHHHCPPCHHDSCPQPVSHLTVGDQELTRCAASAVQAASSSDRASPGCCALVARAAASPSAIACRQRQTAARRSAASLSRTAIGDASWPDRIIWRGRPKTCIGAPLCFESQPSELPRTPALTQHPIVSRKRAFFSRDQARASWNIRLPAHVPAGTARFLL
jgi:hypothetical protein